jgi:hypothetical protein
MVLNSEHNGVELSFNGKPELSILNTLKNAGFRWHNTRKIWYARQNDKTLAIAKQYADTETQEGSMATQSKPIILSLYNRVQFIEGNTDTNKYNYRFIGSNYKSGISVKDIAAEIRKHLKTRFPEVKFSITSDYNRITITIKSSPYQYLKLAYDPQFEPSEYRKYEKENNKEINAIKSYCQKLLDSYNYDDSDSMTDYFDVGFYGHVDMDYNYTQTEQSEVIQIDIADFRQKLIEAEKAEEERKAEEFKQYLKQKDIEAEQAKIRAEQDKKDIAIINNNVSYVDLVAEDQYMINNVLMANLNKNNTLDEYTEQIKKSEYYNNDIKITRKVIFKTEEAYNLFCNKLLYDFDFINGTGGSYTDDLRINSMTDYHNMDEEERKTVKFNLEGIAVYCNDQLKFVIDAQGYSYSRYVGLIGEDTEQGSIPQPEALTPEIIQYKIEAAQIEDISTDIVYNNGLIDKWQGNTDYYKLILDEFKQKQIKLKKGAIQQISIEELKIELYKLLSWSDTLQNQFNDANIAQGERLTLYYISDFGMVSQSRITFDSFESCKYAQYDNAVKLTFTPEHKRNKYYCYFYEGKCLIIFKGWHILPDNVLYDISESNGFTCKKSKYLSCDRQQIEDIKTYFENEKHLKPIIEKK